MERALAAGWAHISERTHYLKQGNVPLQTQKKAS